MSQEITIEDISKVAMLARLELTEAEKLRLTSQLNEIMVHFVRLQELDTFGTPPTSHSVSARSVLRDDIPRPSLPREAATANAPEKRDGNFIVPLVVEE